MKVEMKDGFAPELLLRPGAVPAVSWLQSGS